MRESTCGREKRLGNRRSLRNVGSLIEYAAGADGRVVLEDFLADGVEDAVETDFGLVAHAGHERVGLAAGERAGADVGGDQQRGGDEDQEQRERQPERLMHGQLAGCGGGGLHRGCGLPVGRPGQCVPAWGEAIAVSGRAAGGRGRKARNARLRIRACRPSAPARRVGRGRGRLRAPKIPLASPGAVGCSRRLFLSATSTKTTEPSSQG
jgi:hypothetical protein